MVRHAIALIAAVMLTGMDATPTVPPPILALLGDAEAAQRFDYYGLKAAGADLNGLNAAVEARLRPELANRCITQAEQAVLVGLKTAADAPDAAAWTADRDGAGRALARWRALRESVLSGDKAPPPYEAVGEQVAALSAVREPRKRALLERAALDQFMRASWVEGSDVWLGPLSEGARTRVNRTFGGEGCRVDADNAAWLERELATHGWYRRSIYGEDGDAAAWLIVQHADRDLAFQQRVLALLEPLIADGETDPANYAYLHDRVAVNGGRPQRYGTQGGCTAPGQWTPRPMEDPAGVDARRRQMGLAPLDAERPRLNARCARFAG